MRSFVPWIFCYLFFSIGFSSCGYAESLTYLITNDHPNTVQISFYASSRDVAWPGNGGAYDLNRSGQETIVINCLSGEQICFGAWVKGKRTENWGRGFGGKNACEKCCNVCNGAEIVRKLNP